MDTALGTEKERKRNKNATKFLKMLSLEAAFEILEYLNDHGESRYKDLEHLTSTYSLSTRLKQLLKYNLIEHHFEKEETRTEWYTITEKGRKALTILNLVEELAERG